MRVHKKASQAVQQDASHRLQIQRNIVAIVAVVAVLIMFWLSAVPALNWFERTGDAAALRDAREQWLQADIRDYEFSYDIACLCDESTAAPVTMIVRGNMFVRAHDAETDERVEVSDTVAIPRTMTDAFDHAARVLDEYPDAFEASYDVSYGFPAVVRVDPDKDISGDEVGYYVSHFRPLITESYAE